MLVECDNFDCSNTFEVNKYKKEHQDHLFCSKECFLEWNKDRKLSKNWKKLTQNLSYILGTIKGDGCINENHIRLSVIDLDFINEFRKNCKKQFGIEMNKHKSNNQDIYYTDLCSKKVTSFIRNFDLNDILTGSKEVKGNFLRGFFDSDGGAYTLFENGRTDRSIEIANKDYDLIKFSKKLLNDLNIEILGIDERKRGSRKINGREYEPFTYYRIQLRSNKDNYLKFRKWVGFSITRKQETLNTIINSYQKVEKNWKESEVKFLQQHYKDMKAEDIAKKLNRTESSIYNKKRRLD